MKAFFIPAAAAAALVAVPVFANSHGDGHKAHMKSMSRADVMAKVEKRFARMDADNDGYVTKQEVESAKTARHEKMAERMKSMKHDTPDRGAMFNRLDSNKDGSISREEFMAAEGMMKTHMAGHHKVMHRMHRMHMGMMHGKMFEMADSNKDGRVSLQEATSMAAAHFDKADSNRDGTLSADEMRKAHEAHKAHMGKPGA